MPLDKTKFTIKRNDTKPSLIANIIDRGRLLEKKGFNLSGVSSVTFTMVDQSCDISKVFNQTAQITCVENGKVQYNWQEGDTDTSGNYMGEFELTFSDGGKLTVPQIGGIEIEIVDDLNQS